MYHLYIQSTLQHFTALNMFDSAANILEILKPLTIKKTTSPGLESMAMVTPSLNADISLKMALGRT